MARSKLTKEEYRVLRDGGTEPPFTGELLYNKATGFYYCKFCGNKLFSSKYKFDPGTGWPSFREAMPDSVNIKFGLLGSEVTCAKCGSHLGHVFNELLGKRYCINSIALKFKGVKK